MARTSQPPHKCLKWTPRWTMPKTRRCLWWNGPLTPMGHCNPEEEYANVIASTNHLDILCFVTGPPLAWLLKPTKSCSDFLYEAEHLMYILRALTGQSRDSWLPVGGGVNKGKRYDLGSERSGEHLRYITQPWFQDDLGVVGPEIPGKQGWRKGPAGLLLAWPTPVLTAGRFSTRVL